jgi:tetratricopeptide (TPR) repeat protein
MVTSSLSKSALAVVICLALAGCKSDAERADEYFRSGMELLEAGDADRAIVQFRNAFEFEENHLEARMAMGNLFLEQGNPGAAYGQFLRVAEQHPDEFEARRILSELAFVQGNWEEFTRHGAVAVEMMPEDPRVRAIDLGMTYRAAVLAEDDPARQAIVAPAEALLADMPENQILNNLLLDSYVRDSAMSKALARLDVLIGQDPGNRQLYTRRLALLAQMQDTAGLETQLRDMVTRFPGDQEVQGMMLRFYVSQQRMDEAEAFLREISDPADEDPGLFLSLINFVSQTRGEEAARVEIERAVAENPNPDRFRAMLAMMDFQKGDQEQAIAEMEAILAQADPAEEGTQAIQTTLARMLVSTGNQVGARRLVEEVLAQNASNVDALKMQASWQLQADETDAAIANLRIALDTAPEDVQVMNLMYEAYMRTGETDVAREFLALAVEASGNAPDASLRYARVLMQEERYMPAEDVLLPALRQNPGNVELLSLLGQLYLRLDDIPRATQVIDTLRRLDTDEGRNVANGLQAEVLNREGGTEEALTFLENLASGEAAGLQEKLVLLRARLQVGETEDALQMAQELVAENPDNLGLKQALATTQLAAGDLDGAKVSYREVTAAAPRRAVEAWQQLIRIANRQGNPEEADAIIEEALAATDNNANILWAKASRLEQLGDIDGAIAIYENLYAQNSGSIVVANNLASLLSTYRDDADSLERAWVIARRLRDIDNPALQDTYGWTLFRRGEVEEALPYLESAAAGLENDPMVQAHLGFAYAALERNDAALAQMQKAVNTAGPADTRPRIEAARAEITRLRSLLEN